MNDEFSMLFYPQSSKKPLQKMTALPRDYAMHSQEKMTWQGPPATNATE